MGDFNTVLLEFLDALVSVFPEVPALASYRALARPVVAANPRLAPQKFLQAVGPHAVKLLQKDPTFFDDCPAVLEGVDMRSMWHQPDLTDESRGIIWTYLVTLYSQAAASLLPADAMTQIQSLAGDLQQRMDRGEVDLAGVLGLLGQPGPRA